MRSTCTGKRDRLSARRTRVWRQREACRRRSARAVRRRDVVRCGIGRRRSPGVVHPVGRAAQRPAPGDVRDRREVDRCDSRLWVVGRSADAERPSAARAVVERRAGDVLRAACRVLRQGQRRARRRRPVEQDVLRTGRLLVPEIVVRAELDGGCRRHVERARVIGPIRERRSTSVGRVADRLYARAGSVIRGESHGDRRRVVAGAASRTVALDRRRRRRSVVADREVRARRSARAVRRSDTLRRGLGGARTEAVGARGAGPADAPAAAHRRGARERVARDSGIRVGRAGGQVETAGSGRNDPDARGARVGVARHVRDAQ